MHRPLTLAACLSLLMPAAGTAQELSARFRSSASPAAAGFAGTTAPLRAAESVEPQSLEETRGPEDRSFLATALHTLGGALVGGWVGYVGSQVALSDWEKSSNGAFADERSRWVAAGMVVGIIGSRLIGGTAPPGPGSGEVLRPRPDRNVLGRTQIASAGARNVYELISTLRKEWLVPRGTNSFRETARGVGSGMGGGARLQSTPGQASVVVYMDGVRLGEIERMREILTDGIMEIRFIEPQEAAYRYGAGHTHGVILLNTSL